MSSPRSYGDGALYGRIKWARPLPFGRDVAGDVNRNVGDTLILLVEDSKCAARMRPANGTVVFRSRSLTVGLRLVAGRGPRLCEAVAAVGSTRGVVNLASRSARSRCRGTRREVARMHARSHARLHARTLARIFARTMKNTCMVIGSMV
jgi:hypothetical protein